MKELENVRPADSTTQEKKYEGFDFFLAEHGTAVFVCIGMFLLLFPQIIPAFLTTAFVLVVFLIVFGAF